MTSWAARAATSRRSRSGAPAASTWGIGPLEYRGQRRSDPGLVRRLGPVGPDPLQRGHDLRRAGRAELYPRGPADRGPGRHRPIARPGRLGPRRPQSPHPGPDGYPGRPPRPRRFAHQPGDPHRRRQSVRLWPLPVCRPRSTRRHPRPRARRLAHRAVAGIDRVAQLCGHGRPLRPAGSHRGREEPLGLAGHLCRRIHRVPVGPGASS